MDAASGAAAPDLPGCSQVIPKGGVENPRVVAVHADVARSGGLAYIKHELPGNSSIARAIDPTFLGGTIGSTLGGDVGQVGIIRVNTNP